MGNKSPHVALSQAVHRAEDRLGRVTIEGRYHRPPRFLEDDYYVGEKVLGSGCSGAVLLAWNRLTGAKVAVKTFRLSGLVDEKKQELVSEVEVYLCMDHPHIARLMEVYESEDVLTLVMEACEGGELYDRVAERKVFAESDAAEATWQMLLAVNYLHREGVVHRDLKLENFLYERQGCDFLKLIDFGFSKIVEKNTKLEISCGTISYVAPEVLAKSYTSQCDMWSLGVIVFVLLAGYMPFHGRSDADILAAIKSGKYTMKPKCWARVSQHAQDFVQRLLVVNPESRMTAEQALEHPWIMERHATRQLAEIESVDKSIADSLTCFAKQTRFRRACMQLMAWSLSREERTEVTTAFLDLDVHHTGVIKLTELKQVLEEKFHLPEDVCCSVVSAFQGLDCESDQEIHYNDFLAAMMSSRLALHDDLLRETFRRFDTGNRGYITPAALQQVLGRATEVDEIFQQVDKDHDGRISVEDLVAYLQSGDALEAHVHQAAHEVIDRELERREQEAAVVDADAAKEVARAAARASGIWRLGSGFQRRRFGYGARIVSSLGGC